MSFFLFSFFFSSYEDLRSRIFSKHPNLFPKEVNATAYFARVDSETEVFSLLFVKSMLIFRIRLVLCLFCGVILKLAMLCTSVYASGSGSVLLSEIVYFEICCQHVYEFAIHRLVAGFQR